ncbi:MAG TPA: peptidoglycan DD-metalloendopeptidase family protein [Thermoanaerobaculia bacterium]|nr:peptidoglycan DD-metalloendopeptidase family protein [Thermoanaerobaculia bacterium]
MAPTPRFVPDAVACPADTLHVQQADLPVQASLQRGQTLGALLAELGFAANDCSAISDQLAEHVELRRLRPGLEVTAFVGEEARPREVEFLLPGRGRLRLVPGEEGWASRWQPFEERVVVRRAEGVIESSLAGAMVRHGVPQEVAYGLAEVMRWDVDFNRDLRAGDRFQVIYEEVHLDGELHRVGNVLAAGLWNRGRMLEAFRFGDDGYYDAEGRPLKKMFLRSPMQFSRVTSKFSHRRFHPVLKRYRPHYGVDYGAPTGTPVRATADGVVTFAGWDRGGGKTIKLRHPNEYLTAYLHLSRFAGGVERGARVRQGEVVGFVGATGLATAPHLDYRVQHRGRWIDPLAMKSVPAEPIADRDLPRFVAWRDLLRQALAEGPAGPMSEPDWQLAALPPAAPSALAVAAGR